MIKQNRITSGNNAIEKPHARSKLLCLSGLKACAVLFLASTVLQPATAASVNANPAITTFNKWCFKAGQTEAQVRANMNADSATFVLTFWDNSLEPRPTDAPIGIERRCEVAFTGDHADAAILAMREQMATPPVFGTKIPLPDTHQPTPGTALIEGRELLRGRVAVVHVGTRETTKSIVTFMAVDRLYDGLGLPEKG